MNLNNIFISVFIKIIDEYVNTSSTENASYNHSKKLTLSDTLDLGPLPSKWEKAYTKNGEIYFIELVFLI